MQLARGFSLSKQSGSTLPRRMTSPGARSSSKVRKVQASIGKEMRRGAGKSPGKSARVAVAGSTSLEIAVGRKTNEIVIPDEDGDAIVTAMLQRAAEIGKSSAAAWMAFVS
jgi:hypothetical protein